MNYYSSKQSSLLATSPAAAAPSLFQQVGMAGSAAVITVSFVHPVDVVKHEHVHVTNLHYREIPSCCRA
eukprot:scaffold249374_cov58-Cyclotella_meneghiniana.AAC.3